jgi:UDP-glucose 4-epimerase
VEIVIHLAAVPDDAPFVAALVPANILGVAAVIDAVRQTPSVARVMVASSGKIFSGYTGATPIDVDTMPAPTCMYSATKLFAEAAALALANSCSDGRQLHVIVPRYVRTCTLHIYMYVRQTLLWPVYPCHCLIDCKIAYLAQNQKKKILACGPWRRH